MNIMKTLFKQSNLWTLQEMTRTKHKYNLLLAVMAIAIILLILQTQLYGYSIRQNLGFMKIIRKNNVSSARFTEDDLLQKSEASKLPVTQTLNFSIEEFYATDLTMYPERSNKLSPFLTKKADVIAEAQRVHMNIFSRLLCGYKYAMLFDFSPSENKGDSAIVVGEAMLLRKFNIEIIFACTIKSCGKHLNDAEKLSKQHTSKELVILFHGGGNVIGYDNIDKLRFEEIPHFMHFKIIMFPQSIILRRGNEHIQLCQKMYSSHPNLTFIWRDTVSYRLGKKLFPKTQSLLSPDIAFQMGQVKRFMDPTQDILWIKRTDTEMSRYKSPTYAGEYRIHVADWVQWPTARGTSPMENSYLMTANGLMFLSRGRVVVTDRLHGFILSILLNIPNVNIDNKQHKLSNYHNSWTRGLEHVCLAKSSEHALVQAIYLLKSLDNELPKISGFYKNTEY